MKKRDSFLGLGFLAALALISIACFIAEKIAA